MQKIVEVETLSAVVSRKGLAVGGVRYVLTLACGHTLETPAYAHTRKHTVPKVGQKRRCKKCP